MPKTREKLLFIDTNILLDFYRIRNDPGLSLLRRIKPLHDQIITTSQVEMEFKKNRQKVICEALAALKAPESTTPPAFLSEAKNVAALKRRVTETKRRVNLLKERIKRVLENPSANDPVYQAAQRLFSHESPYNLTRDNPASLAIQRMAWKRFILGYPPRKAGDNSTGDAINWKWMIHCMERSNKDLVIVSRDADYGTPLDGNCYINDWLNQELKSRVNQQLKIRLFPSLASALKLFQIKVSLAEEQVERNLIPPPVPPAQAVESSLASLLTDGAAASELEGLALTAQPQSMDGQIGC